MTPASRRAALRVYRVALDAEATAAEAWAEARDVAGEGETPVDEGELIRFRSLFERACGLAQVAGEMAGVREPPPRRGWP